MGFEKIYYTGPTPMIICGTNLLRPKFCSNHSCTFPDKIYGLTHFNDQFWYLILHKKQKGKIKTHPNKFLPIFNCQKNPSR